MLQYQQSFKYQLFIGNKEGEKIIERKEKNGVNCNFKSPVTDKNRPKIYVLKLEGNILYIGYTSQSISSRLGSGLRASGINGYHGYKWKHNHKVGLLLFVFNPFSKDDKVKKEEKSFIEAIEAELVFKVRTETGKWPLDQNEIHFNNDNVEEVRVITEKLFTEIIKH